jgi:type II restriction enzyme
MKKQAYRLRLEKIRGKGPKEIFGEKALEHDIAVNNFSRKFFETIKTTFPNLEFRFRDKISKKEINDKLHSVDNRLGVTLFIANSSIKPDGGIIEVKDRSGK